MGQREASVVYANLTAPRQARVEEIQRLIRLAAGLQMRVDTARSDLDWAVTRALDDDVPASVLAEVLSVSTSRVYQIRAGCKARYFTD